MNTTMKPNLVHPKTGVCKHRYEQQFRTAASMLKRSPIEHPQYRGICSVFWWLRNCLADIEELEEAFGL